MTSASWLNKTSLVHVPLLNKNHVAFIYEQKVLLWNLWDLAAFTRGTKRSLTHLCIRNTHTDLSLSYEPCSGLWTGSSASWPPSGNPQKTLWKSRFPAEGFQHTIGQNNMSVDALERVKGTVWLCSLLARWHSLEPREILLACDFSWGGKRDLVSEHWLP